MSLIEKIDARLYEIRTNINLAVGSRYDTERTILANRLDECLKIKEIYLSEQKEPCEYCNSKTSKFEPILISDTEHDCKWCHKEKCDNHDDSCYGIGYGTVPLKYCPNCGNPINQPQEDTK